MAQESPDLDRLIEEGLTRYGQGDLDGALGVWEEVLAVDPENPQANSYVDYVRLNYALLTSEPASEAVAPFGIADDGEPEYQIEIRPGEQDPIHDAKANAIRNYMDSLDEGWSMEGEGTTSDAATYDRELPEHEIPEPDPEPAPAPGPDDDEPEIEIDHGRGRGVDSAPPPLRLELELEADEPIEGPGISFDDATREYQGGGASSSAASDAAVLEFGSEGTPGFGQTTDIRNRDLGFVKPTAPPAATEPGARPRRVSKAPELQITLRNPHPSEDPTDESAPAPPPPAASSFELTYATADLDLPTGDHAPLAPLDPTQAPSGRSTRDLPAHLIAPRPPVSDAEDPPAEPPIPMGSAPTRELGELQISFTKTQDFGDKPTRQISLDGLRRAGAPDPLVSAPTRELGLRSQAQAAAAQDRPSEPEGTRADIVLPFDPIDARSARILDDVDDDAPAQESKEDQTRRRITSLLEHAARWATTNEMDRAVAAVDLALSEDPNSALAQKLIQRNRETIMGVFQAFLGELDRQPSLARPLHELANAPISPRAAFLLSRVDGTLTLDEILDVSGMPRLEAYRYLSQLFLRGILR